MRLPFISISAFLLLTSPTIAQVMLDPVDVCINTAMRDQSDPSQCIETVQNRCLDNALETPAVATLCFQETQSTWSDGITAVMSGTVAAMDEPQASVTQIETKYDLLGNLLQCDRFAELSAATADLSGPEMALQSARCQSTATALTYLRLYLRTQTPE